MASQLVSRTDSANTAGGVSHPPIQMVLCRVNQESVSMHQDRTSKFFLALKPTQPCGPSSTGHGRVQGRAQVLTGGRRRSRAILGQVSS